MSTAPETSRPATGKSRWVILGLVLLVALPIGYRGCRGEVDRWRAAQVMESWLDGDKQQAMADLQAISARLPENHRLKLVLGEWLLELGVTDGNDQRADRALELANEIPEPYRDRRSQALIQHSLLALGKPGEALQAYQKANPANEDRSPQAELFHRNALAYYQALAETDLPLARNNSEYVVREVAGIWNSQQDVPLSAQLQSMFCAAMVYRYQMRQLEQDSEQKSVYADEATTVLSGAIQFMQAEYKTLSDRERLAEKLPETAAEFFQDWFWEWLWPESDDSDRTNSPENQELANANTQRDTVENENRQEQEQEARIKDELAHSLATLLTLRALIYQDLGDDDASFADRRQIRKLGFQPETIAEKMPTLSACFFQLELLSMVLDTRGCVYLKMNNSRAAIADLNAAVIGQKALVEVAEFSPRTSQESSIDPRQQFEQFVRGPKRTLAALMFHRSWARRDLNDHAGATADLAYIRRLGFVPGNYLY